MGFSVYAAAKVAGPLLGLLTLGRQIDETFLSEHPHALWRVVHDLCVPDKRVLGLAFPCRRVDLRAGFAVVPDPAKRADIVVVPTRRIVGVEDPYLSSPAAPNYWEDAWSVRGEVRSRSGEPPREGLAMAVNAPSGRSQDQLHIHVSCVRSGVSALLGAAGPFPDTRWSSFTLNRGVWKALWVQGDSLSGHDPFKILDPAGFTAVQRQNLTIVVVAGKSAGGEPGFTILARPADPSTGYEGHGEFLLDETCGSKGALDPRT